MWKMRRCLAGGWPAGYFAWGQSVVAVGVWAMVLASPTEPRLRGAAVGTHAASVGGGLATCMEAHKRGGPAAL